jgi:hypothetical protein
MNDTWVTPACMEGIFGRSFERAPQEKSRVIGAPSQPPLTDKQPCPRRKDRSATQWFSSQRGLRKKRSDVGVCICVEGFYVERWTPMSDKPHHGADSLSPGTPPSEQLICCAIN